MHRITANVRQAEVAAAEIVGEALVVNAEAVEDGGVEVIDVDGVLGDVVAEVIGAAVDNAGLDAGAGKEVGEAARVMVAAKQAADKIPLAVRGAAEFAAPDD